nr:HTH domain-containing protein [Mycobacterium asiaticum]
MQHPRRNRLRDNHRREQILQMVRDHDGGVDAVQLATQIGLHVTTVRFHLDALCDEGVIVRTTFNRPGVGRPRTKYLAVEERLDYRVLLEVLAMELGQTMETRARRAQHAGRKWATRLTASPTAQAGQTEAASDKEVDEAFDRAVLHVTEVFKRMGFDPELTATAEPTAHPSHDSAPTVGRERIMRLHACPVRSFARAHPEVGCAMHLGLLQGLLAQADADGGRRQASEEISAHLEPLVEPELCVARLAAH